MSLWPTRGYGEPQYLKTFLIREDLALVMKYVVLDLQMPEDIMPLAMSLLGGSGDVPDIDAFKKRTCF